MTNIITSCSKIYDIVKIIRIIEIIRICRYLAKLQINNKLIMTPSLLSNQSIQSHYIW